MVNFSWLRLLRGFYLEWSKILENGWQYVLATSTVVCFSCILSLLSSKVTRGTTAEYKSGHLWDSKKNAKLLSAVKILEKDNIQLFHKPPSLIHGYTEWTWNKLKTVNFSQCRSSDCRLVFGSKTDQSSLRLFTSREFFPPATLFGNSPTKRPTDDHLLCTTLVYNVYSGYSVLYSLAMYSTLSITFLPTPYNLLLPG